MGPLREEVKRMSEERIGEISKYFAKVGVAGIQIEQGSLSRGETIHIVGHTTDFTQVVDSIQLENQAIEKATPGQLVGIKVRDRVREKDAVFKVTG
jgi:putative protease